MYVKTNGKDKVVSHRYSIHKLKKDIYPSVLENNTTDSDLAGFNVFPVTVLPQPKYDNATHKILIEKKARLNDGAWEIDWVTKKLTKAQIDEQSKKLKAKE